MKIQHSSKYNQKHCTITSIMVKDGWYKGWMDLQRIFKLAIFYAWHEAHYTEQQQLTLQVVVSSSRTPVKHNCAVITEHQGWLTVSTEQSSHIFFTVSTHSLPLWSSSSHLSCPIGSSPSVVSLISATSVVII